MIDPLTLTTAISAASAAYGQVKKLVQAGREFEEISESLGKWMGAVSDIDNINKNSNNPSTFDRLFNGSIESVAIESFASKKKLAKQREELKNFLIGHYGLKAWDDLIAEEGRIRKARRQAVYEREERNRMIRDYTIIGIASLVGCVAVGCVAWIISGSF